MTDPTACALGLSILVSLALFLLLAGVIWAGRVG